MDLIGATGKSNLKSISVIPAAAVSLAAFADVIYPQRCQIELITSGDRHLVGNIVYRNHLRRSDALVSRDRKIAWQPE